MGSKSYIILQIPNEFKASEFTQIDLLKQVNDLDFTPN